MRFSNRIFSMRFSKIGKCYWTLIFASLMIYTLSMTIFNAQSDHRKQSNQFNEPEQSKQFDQSVPKSKSKRSVQSVDKLRPKRSDCYQYSNRPLNTYIDVLNDISNPEVEPENGTSIFFLMTSCSKNGIINLSTSQACAIESAAYHNPNRTVFVLFASTVGFPAEMQPATLAVLRSNFTNIHFLNVNIDTFVEGTPVQKFYHSGKLFTSKYLIEHMSDFLRFLVLYKYGGIYLDTDVIVQKNFDNLPDNFLGKEAHHGYRIDSVNNAVLGFNGTIGHEILELCLKEVITSYNPDEYTYNGPKLLTRILENKICHTSLAEMTPKKCGGMKVFPPEEFYAINSEDWSHFIDTNFTESVLDATENSSIVHLYNHHWRDKIIKKSKSNTRTAYEAIAGRNCPIVFEASGENI
ncbi:lactosylceramide 4-alpha-galactosyltransferase-like [Sitodiplosis mosellana]|uniref:lactosylceramide 4-alpha-galactosyltransferase-like n=1 Tax=Sitodiplosis mosellana TaxID=263140 RepID=UPI002444360C|nr:lactosylceramide 4-alpha-galactosyltransferase-like [Sitodiplosis mosellana]